MRALDRRGSAAAVAAPAAVRAAAVAMEGGGWIGD